jgi:predicted acetyltransferase
MEFRTIGSEEFEAFTTALAASFGEARPDEHDLEVDRFFIEPERTWAALEDGRIVGCAGTFSLRTVVPGGAVVGNAGVTTVGVLPTHRRRGITTELLGRILTQARERDEPIASLFASQAAIYGRFGFGMATQGLELDVLIDRALFAPGFEPTGTVRLLPREEALPLMRDVYERWAPTRPGALMFGERLFPGLFMEKKDEPHFYAIHAADAGTPDAFAVYRTKHDWPKGLPHVQLKLRQLIAATPQANASMWRFLFDVDLVSRIRTQDRPVDEPLRWQLQEPRAARARLYDGVYARPIDVANALTARRYATDGRLVVAVTDPFVPDAAGTFALTVEGGEPSCVRTDEDPGLACSVNEIGAVYLGGSTWSGLATAGRVEVRDLEALGRADVMFATGIAPWVPFFF